MADLRIKDLVVEYASSQESVRPIDELSLDVSAGSLAILLGPSGCGKTTLLSCLGGILRPTAGRIEFGDIDVTALDARALSEYRRNTVGIVFQAFNLVPSLTALENVMVPLRAARIPRQQAQQRAEELLARVGLAHRMAHRPGDLSGGQQQRVAVARAIALDPPLLIADEPTAHLDYIQVEEVLTLIRELASGDKVVVVATHDTRMLPLADRVVELVPHVSATEHEPETVTLAAGDMLFDPSTRVAARVRADGSIAIKDASGSIHKIGAHVQGAEACNGWTFWHVKKGPNLVPIDMLRQQLRAEMAAAA